MPDHRDQLIEEASRMIESLTGRLQLCRTIKEHYREQLEQAQQDARRYHWLRENIGMDDGVLITYEPGELDFIIDGELSNVVEMRRFNAG